MPLRKESPGADPERAVAECCASRAPAVVTPLRHESPGLRAAFTALRNERVELELTDVPPPEIAVGATCHVSFLHREEPVMFNAQVCEAHLDGEHLRIWLAMPTQISSDVARAAFRIPAGSAAAPRVEVAGDDGSLWEAELVNVSLTGLFLRFSDGRPTLLPDQVCELSVRIAEDRVRLAGVVRRVEPDGVAFLFPDAVATDAGDPARRVVAALERDWHARIRR